MAPRDEQPQQHLGEVTGDAAPRAPDAGGRDMPSHADGQWPPDAFKDSAAAPSTSAAARGSERQHLEACIRDSLEGYFRDLDGVEPALMYEMMLAVVEKPLLEVVMRRAGDNQSRAAQWLGINRNTLRRKLVLHKLAE